MRRLSMILVLALSSLLLLSTCSLPGIAQDNTRSDLKPDVSLPAQFAVSPPLRDIIAGQPPTVFAYQPPQLPRPHLRSGNQQPMEDPAWQKEMLNPVSATIGFNVLGVGMGFPGFAVTSEPSNANLAVGDDQVVQWVNGSFAIFDKLTGVAVTGPIAGNLLWTYLGGPCATENSFYITAQWDKIAHRWVMAENTIAGPKYYTCIAVSRSDDALGQYWLYSYQQPNFPDDPRWGLWTDAYYQSQNMFTSSSFVGARPCAYDRASLLIGTGYSASQICVQLTPTDDSLLPADLDSPNNLPPANQPEIYLGSIGYVNNQVNEYTFKPDFVHQTATITGPTPITVDPYTLACGGSGGACIPQAGTTEPLDSIGDRLMYRLAYRRYAPPFGANRQQWLTNHAVDVNGTVGERWYEFRASLTAPGPPTLFVYQQGTYSPDATYRWMGSIASDQNSDILMGYSTSSSSQYPSIYYTGQGRNGPLGTLDDEAPILCGTSPCGTGSQTDTAQWGYYTDMAVDAQDGCTFWYTNQYYQATGASAWSTRLASLAFPSCASGGDWPAFRYNRLHNGYNPLESVLNSGSIANVVELWTFAASGLNADVGSSPAVANGLVYFGSFGSQFNDFYALDAYTGAFQWTGATNEIADNSPVVADGMVYQMTFDGLLDAFHANGCGTAQCSPVWSVDTGTNSDSSPAVYAGMVYVGSSMLNAITTSGFKCWTAPGNGSPAVVNGVIYVTGYTTLYAYPATPGCYSHTALWSANLPTGAHFGNSAPAVADGVVYVGTNSGPSGQNFYAFDAATGHQLWTGQSSGDINSSPAVANGMIYVGSQDGKLYAYSTVCKTSCNALWASAPTGGPLFSSPAVVNDLVLVGSNDGYLYAYNANGCGGSTTCSPIKSWHTGGLIQSSPAVSNGMIYVGSHDKKLHALGIPVCITCVVPPCAVNCIVE